MSLEIRVIAVLPVDNMLNVLVKTFKGDPESLETVQSFEELETGNLFLYEGIAAFVPAKAEQEGIRALLLRPASEGVRLEVGDVLRGLDRATHLET